jgi:hypothetical protein
VQAEMPLRFDRMLAPGRVAPAVFEGIASGVI